MRRCQNYPGLARLRRRPTVCSPARVLPELPNWSVPTVSGLSSVTLSAAVVAALNTAPAPAELGTAPPVQLPVELQVPLTADAHSETGVTTNVSGRDEKGLSV